VKWYELDPVRMEIEKRLLAQHHPGGKLIIRNGQVRFKKNIRGRKNTYCVEAIFSDRYPYSPMEVYIRQPSLDESCPHRFSGSHLCLHDSGDVGPETTAKIYLDGTIQWIKTYEKWLDGIPWPKTNHS